jgi:hypothetical protein
MFCVSHLFEKFLFTLYPIGEHFLQRPLALSARLPSGANFRGGLKTKSNVLVKVKVAETVEPIIRSSFPESFIFDDFPQ